MKRFKTIIVTVIITIIILIISFYFINKKIKPKIEYIDRLVEVEKIKIEFKDRWVTADVISTKPDSTNTKPDVPIIPTLEQVHTNQTFEDSLGNSVNIDIKYDEFTNVFKIHPIITTHSTTYTNIIHTNYISKIDVLSSIQYINFNNTSIYSIGVGVRLYEKVDIIGGISLYNDTINKEAMLGLYIQTTYKF